MSLQQSQSSSQNSSGSFIPNYQPQLSFLGQFGSDAAGLMDQQMQWAQGQFHDNTDLTHANINNYLSGADSQFGQAGLDLGRYNTYLPGNLAQIDETARSYSSPERIQTEMGRAEADTAQNFQAQRDNLKRELESYGVDPSSGRFAGQLETMGAQQGAAEAAAGTQARLATEATGRALMQQEFQDLGVLPGQAATETNVGFQGTTGAQNAALANTSLGALTLGTTPQYLNSGIADIKFQPLGTTSQGTSQSTSGPIDPSGRTPTGGGDITPRPPPTSPDSGGGSGGGGTGSGGGGTGSGSNGGSGGGDGGGAGGGGTGTGTGSGSDGGGTGSGSGSGSSSSSDNYGGSGYPQGECPTSPPLDRIRCAAMQAEQALRDRNSGLAPSSGDGTGTDAAPLGGADPTNPASDDGTGTDAAPLGGADPLHEEGFGPDGPGANYSSDPGTLSDALSDYSGSNIEDRRGLAAGGPVPEAIPASMSPSGGQQVDDVPAQVDDGGTARLNVGEFVIPRDVTEWMGQKFFQDTIIKARKAMQTHAPAQPSYHSGKLHADEGGVMPEPSTWPTDPNMTSGPRSPGTVTPPMQGASATGASATAPGVRTQGFSQTARDNALAHAPPSMLPPQASTNMSRSWGNSYQPPTASYHRPMPPAQQPMDWSTAFPAFMAWARTQPWFPTASGSGTSGGTTAPPPSSARTPAQQAMADRLAQQTREFQLRNGVSARTSSGLNNTGSGLSQSTWDQLVARYGPSGAAPSAGVTAPNQPTAPTPTGVLPGATAPYTATPPTGNTSAGITSPSSTPLPAPSGLLPGITSPYSTPSPNYNFHM